MNDLDLRSLRATLKPRRHPARLAGRISSSIGTAPRPLPSRTMLAIESVASRLTVVTLALCAAALAISIASRSREAEPRSSLADAAMEGRALRAQDVYAAMTGIGEAGQ